MLQKALRIAGVIGTIVFLIAFLQKPNWPTPDKILIFLTCVFLAYGQALQMLKRLAPFVILLLVYESFRGLVDNLNKNVEFMWMPNVDRWLFSSLPTATLQRWWWNGQIQWYDFAFYLFYMLHFIIPLGMAILIWKKRDNFYWRFMASYVLLSFTGFLTYLFYPAAPPWMASDLGYIEPIERVSSHVWYALGITDFPSLYNKLSPNPVAAVPSLHAGYATLFTLVVWKLFGRKWGIASLIYPLMIYLGTVYQGEHYVIDEILGALYAVICFYGVLWMFGKYEARKKAGRSLLSKKLLNFKRQALVLETVAHDDVDHNDSDHKPKAHK